MKIIQATGLALLVLVAGCAGLVGDSGPSTTINLTVQNDGSGPITYQVTVTDENGEIVSDLTDQLGAGIGTGYDLSVTDPGQHTVVVRSDDWAHTMPLIPATCEAYDLTVRVLNAATQNGGGCVTFRE